MSQNILDVKNLSVSIDTLDGEAKVVENVNFDIKEQTTVALVGEKVVENP